MLLVGDLGYGVVDDFSQSLPEQFINVGIAEQSMIGVAAGMSSAGYRVFVYSIANFPTLRCLEQIRNDVCYHQRDVTVVSVGAGVAYGTHGYTHHAIEDLAIMRALPGMRIISPSDPAEAEAAALLTSEGKGPFYVRLGKNGERKLHSPGVALDLTSPIKLRDGADCVIAAMGSITDNCILAAELLAQEDGIECVVFSCPLVRPLDVEWLKDLNQALPLITVEEHSLEGGFGSIVLEMISDHQLGLRLSRAGLDSEKISSLGSQDHLRVLSGLDPEGLAKTVRRALAC